MDILKNFFENFLRNNFQNRNNITPEIWNSVVIWVNIKLSILTVLFYMAVVGLILLTISSMTNSLDEYFWYLVLGVGGVSILLKLIQNPSFLELENGHIGLVMIFGRIRGSKGEDEEYILSPGLYRKIVRIPFHPEIFALFQTPNRKKPMEYTYEGVKTSDGVPFSGTHSFLPLIEDIWIYGELVLSIGEKEIENIIEEISLEAMNTTFDEYSLDYIMKTENIATILQGHYTETIKGHHDCTISCAVEQHSGRTFNGENFTVDQTGLAGKFLLKTFDPPEEIKNTYIHLAAAPARKRSTIIDADAKAESTVIQAKADKERVELEGEAQAKKEKTIAMATHQVFIESYRENIKELGAEKKNEAIHQAALTANQYAKELLVTMGNSDGTPINEGALERIMAMVFALLPEGKKKGEAKKK